MDNYSIPLRESVLVTLFGLGLPVPALHRKELWGYVRDYDRHIYFPIAEALSALYTAFEMQDSGDYHTDDVVAWLNEASKIQIGRRNFFILKKERTLFTESQLSLEQRISIFNGQSSPPSSKKSIEKANKRQAYYQKGTGSASEGDGEAAEA